VTDPQGSTVPTRPGRRVGIAVGSVRVGVAASDPSALLATPVRTLARDPDETAVAPSDLEEIAALARKIEQGTPQR